MLAIWNKTKEAGRFIKEHANWQSVKEAGQLVKKHANFNLDDPRPQESALSWKDVGKKMYATSQEFDKRVHESMRHIFPKIPAFSATKVSGAAGKALGTGISIYMMYRATS